MRVDLKHDKSHAADGADCETREGRVDRIERVLQIEGALDAAQRARRVEIADKGPPHRTPHSPVLIRTCEKKEQAPRRRGACNSQRGAARYGLPCPDSNSSR